MLKKDSLYLGLVVGLIAPLLTMWLFYLAKFGHMDFLRFINLMFMGGTMSALLSLSLLGNLAAFFLFIWRHRYLAAKGVVMTMFIYGIFIVYFKFFA